MWQLRILHPPRQVVPEATKLRFVAQKMYQVGCIPDFK